MQRHNGFVRRDTISFDHAASAASGLTRGFYQSTIAGGLFFYDNIISITRGGTGAKHCIYLANNIVAGSDYNDLYINAAAGINIVGFYTANRVALADWKLIRKTDNAKVFLVDTLMRKAWARV